MSNQGKMGGAFNPAADQSPTGHTVTLDTDQIKALPTSYVELVAAPGANKLLIVSTAVLYVTIGSAYTGVDVDGYLLVGYGDWDQDASTSVGAHDFMTNAAISLAATLSPPLVDGAFHGVTDFPVIAEVVPTSNTINAPLKLAANNGADFTGGDGSTLIVSVAYLTLDTSTGAFV